MNAAPANPIEQALAALNAGRLAEAEQACRALLAADPQHADALHLLGIVAHMSGKQDLAAELIEQSLDVTPANPAAYNSLGEAHRAAGRFDAALRAYRRAVALSPQFVAPYGNAAAAMMSAGKIDDAIRACLVALQIDPNSVSTLNTIGNAYSGANRPADAIAAFEKALAIDPNDATVHNNFGATLESVERLDEAAARYEQAARLNPRFTEAWNNLGNVRQKQMDMPAAETAFRRALEANPDYPDAQWNLGLAALARGDYAAGWPGFLQRFRCGHSAKYWREYAGKTYWDGSPLNGRTILLYGEQGYGDVIQFARFVPHVARRGGRVVIAGSPELVPLLRRAEGVAEVTAGEMPADFDFFYPLLSVPGLLNLSITEVASPPYLSAAPERVAAWRQKLAHWPGPRVGLVWSGRQHPDPKRSAALTDLAELLAIEGVTFFSLQKGEAAADLAASPWAGRVVDLNSDLHDFAETAAAMAGLDHVVTIDTAAAHVAGAVGVPTSLMLTRPADWRWLFDRGDSPWYPSMTVYRQQQRGDWRPVVAGVAAALRQRFSK